MWDFSIGRSIDLMIRTMPFILFRMAVYFGIAAAYVLATGTGAGIGWGIGGFGVEDFRIGATFWGGLIGFGITAGTIWLLREYILYIVKAGHIAVMVEYLDGKPLPEGRGQIAHARTIVQERFAEANLLFALDLLVKGVIGTITGLIRGMTLFLPIPGIDQIMSLIRAVLRLAVGLIDEVILGHIIRARATNPWQAAETAPVLYGQNYQPMLRNAAWLTAMTYGLSFVVFLVMLMPAAAVVYLIPGAWSAGGLVFATLFAWAFKAALIEPFAIACMLQAYFKTIEGQTPDPVWQARLAELSGKFRELQAKAMSWIGGTKPEAPTLKQGVPA
jgi:hypothetical protein